ncbi:MAG TPA: glycosyltransferase [Pyrinomonadaceae bacterium]|nr:glycosyltransferase [Pyrinomonadaceae bacterium]
MLSLRGCRIIFVLFNLELGGAERQALILARHLAEKEKADVEVWGFNKTGPVAQICEQLGLTSRLVSYPFDKANPWSLRKLTGIFREASPDILLPYTFVPNVICGLIWKSTGAGACVWNQRDEGRMPFVADSARAAAQRTPMFISNSERGASFLVDKLEVDPLKIKVIKNGIELSLPQDDRFVWRDRLMIDDDCFVACMIANLHAKKDHETLLRAWRRVVNEIGDRKPVLVLAGRHDGAYESLAALTRELNLNDHVRFSGQISDVSGLLKASDLGVFSSTCEGCPNGVLESMAAGLAVAGTDIDQIRSVLGPDSSEFLAPPKDDVGLATAILKLANDADLRITLGTANRKRVEENYTASRMCDETVAVLKELQSLRSSVSLR